MQGATTDDEPMGRNPGTSEAANLTALKVRGCDLAPRLADLIEASGHVPCFKAVHMNAPSARAKSIEKPLAPRAVPHMRLIVLGNGPRHAIGSDLGYRNSTGSLTHARMNTLLTQSSPCEVAQSPCPSLRSASVLN